MAEDKGWKLRAGDAGHRVEMRAAGVGGEGVDIDLLCIDQEWPKLACKKL